jgi:fatty acyl-CoA reductase
VIREALAGRTLLVTGTTGFLGKSIVEKCLRAVPEIGAVRLGIRPSRRSARERLEREVLASPAFRRLKEELGQDAFRQLVAEKVGVVELDLDRDDLGLDEDGAEELARCDVVVHSAAAVEFDNPADLAARTNLLGAARLVRALVRSPARPHLVHVSTAFVGGMLRGSVAEELPLDPGLNWRHEAEVLGGLRAAVEEESRRPEVLDRLLAEARRRLGPAGVPAQARQVERLRQRWVQDRLVERGRAQARALGFTDIYSFTKALAEYAVTELQGDLPVSIVRPSIIESALAEPFPGWLEGFRMAEPLILAFARAALPEFSGLPDAVMDIVPADLVVNAVLAVAAAPPPLGQHRIYHVTTGSQNPLRLRQLYELCGEYFERHPLRDRWGQAVGTPTWTFPSRGELMARGRAALGLVEAAQRALELLPLRAATTRWSDGLAERQRELARGLELAELYGVYMEVDTIFEAGNLPRLWRELDAAERHRFPFDPAGFTWRHYLHDVHLPTVIRMSRAETVRRGPGPTGSTVPRPSGNPALTALQRRVGRTDVLAVFDVDGTLVQTNVVEYFLWMRLQDQPLEEWPRFLAGIASRAPRWLYLERRSRAEFQRAFYREYEGLEVERMRELGREALHTVTLRRAFPEGIRRIRAHRQAGHRVLLLTGALDVVVEPLAELLDVEVDCARLLTRDGVLTGDLSDPPPAGEARAAALRRYARRHRLDLAESFAYADSISDLPMLEAVGTPVVVNPDPRLSRVADQRGWRVERWSTAPGNWRLPIPDPRSRQYRERARV